MRPRSRPLRQRNGWPTMERRKTILICDDEPALRELIRASMDDGFDFAEASDGIIAMELAKELSPDMVILDLMLPRLSDDEELRDVPVLVITAWNETREDVLAAGADEFVTKPFDPEELRTAVKRLVAA